MQTAAEAENACVTFETQIKTITNQARGISSLLAGKKVVILFCYGGEEGFGVHVTVVTGFTSSVCCAEMEGPVSLSSPDEKQLKTTLMRKYVGPVS